VQILYRVHSIEVAADLKRRRARLRGEVDRHEEAVSLLREPGDMALVLRGIPRLLIFACPDGCGEIVPVNLDSRVGKAWSFYQRETGSTLYPSVWRTGGCRSHFILWDDLIYWDGLASLSGSDGGLRQRVAAHLTADEFRSFSEVAIELNEIPWAVWVACDDLVRLGEAIEGSGRGRGRFRLADHLPDKQQTD
jgi:hypothetical protein